MIVNSNKFPAVVVKRNNEMKDPYPLNINQKVINNENCIRLLEVGINNDLSFKKHFYTRRKSK